MNNKQPNKQKDPKKVAAGKARAAKAVRINGQFVTKFFQAELQKDAAAVGHTGSLQTFLDQNEVVYSDLYHTGTIRSASEKSDTTIFKEAASYSGKILLNDEIVNDTELKYQTLKFEQFMFANFDCAGIAYKPKLSFDGKMIFELPENLEELEDMSNEDLIEYLESLGIKVWLSTPKDKKRQEQIENKAAQINKRLKDARVTKTKSRTKPRRR